MSDESNGIGVITHIDGTQIEDITPQHREQWAEQLKQKLQEIESVAEVETYPKDANNQEVEIVVGVERTKKRGYSDDRYYLEANTHSISQRIMNKVREDEYAGANIVDPQLLSSPESVGENRRNGRGIYKNPRYVVYVSYP